MNKPLIILVDDEPSVLEALDASLRPTFEEVCRVESFDDPRAVLEALPEWSDERRPIAVAIVDQKMPGLTGVELLSKLRSGKDRDFDPAAHTQSILLTGYAGLESAVAAKNAAAVRRYLEKPWRPDGLAREVRELFVDYLDASAAGRHFVFREIQSVDELCEYLRVRCEVYRKTAGSHLLPGSDAHLDVDEFDAVSHFLGLFDARGSKPVLVGTLRVTGQTTTPGMKLLQEVLEGKQDLLGRLEAPRRFPLPLLKYLIDSPAVASLFEEFMARDEGIVEAGRLSLIPGMRRGSTRGMGKLARHIIDSSAAFGFFSIETDGAILTCCPPHDRFYRPLGFGETPGTEPRHHEEFGLVVICMFATRQGIPADAEPRLKTLAAAMDSGRGACYCPTFPDCMPEPYERLSFGGTDLFCPYRANAMRA